MCGHALQTSTDQNQGGSNQLTSDSVLVYVCLCGCFVFQTACLLMSDASLYT